MRNEIKPRLPQRQLIRVEVKNVRLVLVHHVSAAHVPVLAEGLGRHGIALGEARVLIHPAMPWMPLGIRTLLPVYRSCGSRPSHHLPLPSALVSV